MIAAKMQKGRRMGKRIGKRQLRRIKAARARKAGVRRAKEATPELIESAMGNIPHPSGLATNANNAPPRHGSQRGISGQQSARDATARQNNGQPPRLASIAADGTGGVGEGGLPDSGLHDPQTGLRDRTNAWMEHRAVREGWGNRQAPWNLDITPSELAKKQQTGQELSANDLSLAALLKGLLHPNVAVQQVALKSAITMHGQNQSGDQHHDRVDVQSRALDQRENKQGVSVGVGPDGTQIQTAGVQIFIPHNGRDELPSDAQYEDGMLVMGGGTFEGEIREDTA